MTDGNLLIEKLLSHATAKLELSDYDVECKRRLLKHLLLVNDQESAEGCDNEQAPEGVSLKKELISYALEKGLTHNGSTGQFACFVMGLLSPLPSAVNKKFRTMREQLGASSACEYLRNLSVGAWGIDELGFTQRVKPYEQDGALELFIVNTDGDAATSHEHSFCEASQTDTATAVNVYLDGKEGRLHYVDSQTRDEQCLIYTQNNELLPPFESRIISMLDMVEYIPHYSVTATNDPAFMLGGNTAATFIGGKYAPTAFTQKPDFTLNSRAYQDVEVCLFHQMNSGIRLQSFNRNTLERLACEILTAWQGYGAREEGEQNVVCNNYSSVCARFSSDGRYCIDLVLTSKHTGEIQPAQSGFEANLTVEALFGRVVLNQEFASVLKMIGAVLTKKIPLDKSLFGQGASLEGFEGFVNGLVDELGYFKDEQRALNQTKALVIDEYKRVISQKSPFTFDDEGIRAFKIFLASVDVK